MSRHVSDRSVAPSPDSDAEAIGAAITGKFAPFIAKPVKRKLNSDLREVIQNAFYKAGGRDYLVRVAQRRPDVFLQLLSKVMPAEAHISVLHGYQALPVRVEVRDAIPAVIEAQTIPGLPAPTQVEPQAIPVSMPAADEDWLA